MLRETNKAAKVPTPFISCVLTCHVPTCIVLTCHVLTLYRITPKQTKATMKMTSWTAPGKQPPRKTSLNILMPRLTTSCVLNTPVYAKKC